MTDGNTEQIQQVINQIVQNIADNPPRVLTDMLDEHVGEKIAVHHSKFENRMYRWAMAQFMGIAVAAFFLGGLWIQMASVPETLEGRRFWMEYIELRISSIEREMGEEHDYVPPTRRPETR